MKKNILELRSGKLFRGPVKSEVFFSFHLSGSPDLRQARFTMTEDLRLTRAKQDKNDQWQSI